MARKYICDNCGREFASLFLDNGAATLFAVGIASEGLAEAMYWKQKELCAKCKEKLQKILKEGF